MHHISTLQFYSDSLFYLQVLGVYTTQLHPVTSVSTSLPAALLVGDESTTVMDDSSELETSDVEVDC